MSQRAFRALTTHHTPAGGGLGYHNAYDAEGTAKPCRCESFPWPDFPAGHDAETGEVLNVEQIGARKSRTMEARAPREECTVDDGWRCDIHDGPCPKPDSTITPLTRPGPLNPPPPTGAQ